MPGDFTKTEASTPGTFVAVATTGTAVVAANNGRAYLILTNLDGTNFVDLSFSSATAVAGSGVRLRALGAPLVLRGYQGAVSGIANTATVNVGVVEI